MKPSRSSFAKIVFSSTLLWSASLALADGPVVRETANVSAYCYMILPPHYENSLPWARSVPNESAGYFVNVYGPCDHAPTGDEETGAQRWNSLENYFRDGEYLTSRGR